MIENVKFDNDDIIDQLQSNFKDLYKQKEELKNEFINNPYTKIYIYREGQDILGLIHINDIYDRYEINNIYVLKEYRQRGVASSLINKIIEMGKEQKIKNITLEVRIDNYPAINLYKKYGFVEKCLRKGYYRGTDGILMEKEMMSMKDIYILGIESSCDETSCSIVKNGKDEMATIISSQIDIHKNFGGVVPEIASREHVKNITMVIEECLNEANMKMEDIDAIAVTYGPGLIGSLLIGLEAAKTLSYIYNKPLLAVNHIAGHIYANNLVKEMKFPLLALVISGGHTDLIYMRDHLNFEKLGGTLDDAVGECYDKVARVVGIAYPGGPSIDKMASVGKDCYELPLPLNDNSYNFSFSGLKSAVINLNHNEEQKGNKINKEDLATSFQKVVVEIISKKVEKAIRDKKIQYFITAGGVAANKGIRESLSKICEKYGIDYSFPNIKYCTDNAAMIAAAGYFYYINNRISNIDINAKSNDILK